jgi:hypothetical protein
MEGRGGRKLDDEPVAVEGCRPCFAEDRGARNRAVTHGGKHGLLPRILNLLEIDVARGGGRRGGRCRLAPGGGGLSGTPTRLQLLEPVGDRLAREVGARPCHLDERELEREAGVAALADILDRDGEEVDQPQDLRVAELVRLRAQPLPRLRRDG